MFGSFYYTPFQFQRQQQQAAPAVPGARPPNPRGAEYNVPYQDIAPGQNQVNIQGGAGAADRGAAYEAFRRMFLPYAQSQADMITGSNVRPIDAQGAPIPGAPQQFGAQDFENAAQGMFQRYEDRDLLNRYFRGNPFGRY